MIKVYVDWNVMSQLKQGHSPELLKLLERKHQLYVIYSTSHISDILVSYSDDNVQQNRIKEDLDFISSLTDNWCAHMAENQVTLGLLDPNELFEARVIQDKGYGEEGPLAYILTLLDQGTPMYDAIQAYINMPMPESISAAYKLSPQDLQVL